MKVTIEIGALIREELRRQGKTNRWLAEAIHVNRRTVNKIFLKNTIDTYQLSMISEVLGMDFFKFFSDNLDIAQ